MRKSINQKEGKKNLSAHLFGIFLEDINYGMDGGLYAELLENRNFEAMETLGGPPWHTYHTKWDGGYAWSLYPKDCAAKMDYCTKDPYSEVNPHYLCFTAREAGCGFANQAYSGLFLKKGMTYRLSFYAKTQEEGNALRLLIAAPENPAVYEQTEEISVQTGDWRRYETEITASADISGAVFAVQLMNPGSICFDWFSVMPKDAVLGIFRKDLFQALMDLKPAFVRFPGGCVVEGNTLENRYLWKESLGLPEFRKNNWNRWAVHESKEENGWKSRHSHYNQTLGIGFYEYFLMCEALHAEPVPIVNVGMACQYQSDEMISPKNPMFRQYIQDTLDLIEFANGDVSTNWGSLRKEMGHEAPFGLKAVGIGNEQWQTEREDYFSRYEVFEKIIHAHYPNIRLVGTAGPDVTSHHYTDAWEFYRSRHTEQRINPVNTEQAGFVYAVDEHYYMPPAYFFEHNDFYDNYPRDGILIFAGEYAAHNKSGTNDFESALAEAAYLTGIERNSDVVVWAAYAPLLARKGFSQWKPDLIWFDETNVYLTPNYYVQQLFANYRGNLLAPVKVDHSLRGTETVCTYEETKEGETYYIKVIRTEKEGETITLTLPSLREDKSEKGSKEKQDRYVLYEFITMHHDELTADNDDTETSDCKGNTARVLPVHYPVKEEAQEIEIPAGKLTLSKETVILPVQGYSVNVLVLKKV